MACGCTLPPLHMASPALKVEGLVPFSHRGFGLHVDLSGLPSLVLVLHFESVNSDTPSVHFCHSGQQIPSFSEESKLHKHRVKKKTTRFAGFFFFFLYKHITSFCSSSPVFFLPRATIPLAPLVMSVFTL